MGNCVSFSPRIDTNQALSSKYRDPGVRSRTITTAGATPNRVNASRRVAVAVRLKHTEDRLKESRLKRRLSRFGHAKNLFIAPKNPRDLVVCRRTDQTRFSLL